jgi:hypothetical protein
MGRDMNRELMVAELLRGSGNGRAAAAHSPIQKQFPLGFLDRSLVFATNLMSDPKKRLASLHDAREAFFKALKTHEHSIYKLGFDEGFGEGWEAAIARLAELKPAGLASPTHGDLSAMLNREEGEIPAHETLLKIIAKTPGMQHQEIVDIACKTLSTLNERTVRTALQRMKGAGELYVTDNRWYVTRRQKPQSAGA